MRLLILGTGGMAGHHARHFKTIAGVEIVGGVDVDPGRLAAFRSKFDVPRGFSSIEEALDWGEFDAVSNITPDAKHHPTTMKVIAAGKHILCEKPLAVNFKDAMEMTEAAEAAGIVSMVNLTYRNIAQLHAARRMVLDGEIGTVRHVEASYLQGWLSSQVWTDGTDRPWVWRLSRKHGSNGVLGDLGIHLLDFVSYGANLEYTSLFCKLTVYNKVPNDTFGDYVFDANDSFGMTATLSNGALATIHSSRWATGHSNDLKLRLYGEKGGVEVRLELAGPGLRVSLGDDLKTDTWREVEVPPTITNYQRFVDAVRGGKTIEPSFRTAARLQRVLDLALVSDERHAELPVQS